MLTTLSRAPPQATAYLRHEFMQLPSNSSSSLATWPKYMILVRSSSSEALSCGMTSTVLLPADLQYHQFAHTYRSSPSHLLPSSALRQTPFPPERCDITSSRVTNNQRLSLATRFSTQKWYSLSAIEVIEYPGTGGNSTPANSFK